jgi:hypothetical protein
MANVFDIKSANVIIGTAAANTNFDIGAVPAGKQRFITYVKAFNMYRGAGSNTLYLASHSTSQLATLAAATAAKKMTIPFRIEDVADQRVQVPERGPDIQTPLFTIAASNYLAARATTGNVDVFVQYYED